MNATTTLIDPNLDAQGYPIDHRMNERASIIGTIMFLEQLTRHGALSATERKAARHQADFLKALVRKRSRDGKDTFDGAMRDAIETMMIEHAKRKAHREPDRLTFEAEGGGARFLT